MCQVKLLAGFSDLLWTIPGSVSLDAPQHRITLLEDYGALRHETAAQNKVRSRVGLYRRIQNRVKVKGALCA